MLEISNMRPIRSIGELEVGDVIRNVGDAKAFTVVEHFGDHATAVRTIDVSNPSEWLVMVKPRDTIAEEQFRLLASAMRKVLRPSTLDEVIRELDPLTPFVAFLRRYEQEQR